MRQTRSRKTFSTNCCFVLRFAAVDPNWISFIQAQMNHGTATHPQEAHARAAPRDYSRLHLEAHIVTAESPFPRDGLGFHLIGFSIICVSTSCNTAPAWVLYGMKHLNPMFPFKHWTWLLFPSIGEGATNRPLSLVLHLFSRPALRFPQKGELTSFRGMLSSKPAINPPVLFPPDRYKTCLWTGTQSYCENVTQQKQSRGICQKQENYTGKEGKS